VESGLGDGLGRCCNIGPAVIWHCVSKSLIVRGVLLTMPGTQSDREDRAATATIDEFDPWRLPPSSTAVGSGLYR
jgi:hypothetical protein